MITKEEVIKNKEAIQKLQDIAVRFVPTDQYGDYDDPEPYDQAIDTAIEALSADTRAVYCWECKYQHDCVQYMMVEGKYEIIHSCSYGERKEV